METEIAERMFVFECRGKHRIVRKSEDNAAPCSRCDGASRFELVGSVDRQDGETETAQRVRALMLRKVRVN